MLAPNYGVVLDASKETHLEYEPLLPTDAINQYLGRKNNFVETQYCANFRRARHFFYSSHHSPICTEVMEEYSSASFVQHDRFFVTHRDQVC